MSNANLCLSDYQYPQAGLGCKSRAVLLRPGRFGLKFFRPGHFGLKFSQAGSSWSEGMYNRAFELSRMVTPNSRINF